MNLSIRRHYIYSENKNKNHIQTIKFEFVLVKTTIVKMGENKHRITKLNK